MPLATSGGGAFGIGPDKGCRLGKTGEGVRETQPGEPTGGYGSDTCEGERKTAGVGAMEGPLLAGGAHEVRERGEAEGETTLRDGVVERPRLLDPPGVELVGPALLLGHAFGTSRLSCCSKEG